MVKIVSPYLDTVEYSRVKLESKQINTELYANLKFNLRSKLKGKCNKNGYVDEIYKITEYGDGFIYPEDLSVSPIYQVKFNCRMCVPLNDTYIIAKVKVFYVSLLCVTHGPIVIFISSFSNNFTVNGSIITHNKTKKVLTENDYIIVNIKRTQINYGDTNIRAIGYLEDIPNEDQVSTYYQDVIESNSI
jgi:DNA-directed RNA polymerase subunit E'/Rpb7